MTRICCKGLIKWGKKKQAESDNDLCIYIYMCIYRQLSSDTCYNSALFVGAGFCDVLCSSSSRPTTCSLTWILARTLVALCAWLPVSWSTSLLVSHRSGLQLSHSSLLVSCASCLISLLTKGTTVQEVQRHIVQPFKKRKRILLQFVCVCA